MPAYSSLAAGNFPLTDKLATVTIGLPMHYYLTDEDFERIATALSEIRNS